MSAEIAQPSDHWTSDVMRFKTLWIDNVTPMCVIRMLKSDVSDEVWDASFKRMRQFLKWIKKTGYRYHFLFDLHESDSIPVERLYALQAYLKKKRELLISNLHSSAVITQSNLLEILLNNAFEVWPPTRPFKIIIQPVGPFERDTETEIPLTGYRMAMRHLLDNKLS